MTRRFVLLAAVLAALNVALWLAGPGLALRHAVVQQLFGPQLVRAQALHRDGTTWYLDRGVIVQVNSSQVTLRESDGKVQPIPVSAGTTHVIRLGRRLPIAALARGWHVLVTWPATGPAVSVDVERLGKAQTSGAGAPPPHLS